MALTLKESAKGIALPVDSWSSVVSVLSLLFSCGPTTVVRSIACVIVYALYRVQSCWLFAHVFQKRFKTFRPLLAYSNSSSSVSVVMSRCGVCAPVAHSLPRLVFRCVRGAMRCYGIMLKAAATSVITRSKVADNGAAFFPAFTATEVRSLLPLLRAF